jgi:metal-dependent HD superfamily phosphatase/phosphodiesterase
MPKCNEDKNEKTTLHVPTMNNKKLGALLRHISKDKELMQLWKCANINAVDRSGISDHGDVHIQIVANAALKIIRLLAKGGVEPSVVKDHGMKIEDSEVIVVLAACLHDIGIAVHRDNHEKYSVFMAYPKVRGLLTAIYEEPELTTMTSEVMHAIIAHHEKETCLTIEAGVLKVADTLDMTKGRSRIPFESGKVNIHSVSAQAIESVDIEKGDDRPIRLVIKMANSAGIYQVDELLRRKLKNSTLEDHIKLVAKIEGETERKLIEVYNL